MSVARLKASLAASKKLGIPRYESLQPNYNLYDRVDFESQYAPLCQAEGIGVITYYSLAGGFLTGKYRAAADAAKNPARGGKVKGYFDARGRAHPQGARRSLGASFGDAGANRAGLADRAAWRHRTDIQRHRPRAAHRDHAGAAAQAFARRPRRARSRQRLVHDPEKWEPIFGKDHAQTKCWRRAPARHTGALPDARTKPRS